MSDPFILRACGRAAIVVVAVLAGLLAGRLSQVPVQQQSAPQAAELPHAKAGLFDSPVENGFWKDKADALMRPKLWAVDTKTQTNETFWGRYRKELSNVKTDRK